MEELEGKARRRSKAYRGSEKARNGAINALKGYVHEKYINDLPEIQDAITRARSAATEVGVDPDSIHFTTDVRDRSRDKLDRLRNDELSDGVIIGVRSWETRADGNRVPKELVVFGLVEAKSKESVGKLHTEKGELGQFERSRARFETGRSIIEGREYWVFDGNPHDARAGRLNPEGPTLYTSSDFGKSMRLVGVIPADVDVETKRKLRNRLDRVDRNDRTDEQLRQKRDFVLAETPWTDAEYRRLAIALLEAQTGEGGN
jgi:hypothetical protein